MIRMILALYSLLVLIYAIVRFMKVPGNDFTRLLETLVEPALKVTRQLMKSFLPFLCGKGIDLSPVVLIVVLEAVRWLLTWLV